MAAGIFQGKAGIFGRKGGAILPDDPLSDGEAVLAAAVGDLVILR
jgi:hypothetical protein